MMKNVRFLSVCLSLLSVFGMLFYFSGCDKEDTVPTYIVTNAADEAEETTEYEGETLVLTEEEYNAYMMEQMSPSSFDYIEPPLDLTKKMGDIDFSAFEVMDVADSYITDSEAKTVYKDGYNQYFVFASDTAFVLLTDGEDETDRTYFYSAYYHEGGDLFFIGTDVLSWYYDENGEVYLLVYTYVTESNSEIISFYLPSGERIGIRAGGLYYNNQLDEMSDEEYLSFVQKIGAVSEIV